MSGWEVTEAERGGLAHAPFAYQGDAYAYLMARVDRWKGKGWRLIDFKTQPHIRVTLASGKKRKVIEAKRQVR